MFNRNIIKWMLNYTSSTCRIPMFTKTKSGKPVLYNGFSLFLNPGADGFGSHYEAISTCWSSASSAHAQNRWFGLHLHRHRCSQQISVVSTNTGWLHYAPKISNYCNCRVEMSGILFFLLPVPFRLSHLADCCPVSKVVFDAGPFYVPVKKRRCSLFVNYVPFVLHLLNNVVTFRDTKHWSERKNAAWMELFMFVCGVPSHSSRNPQE